MNVILHSNGYCNGTKALMWKTNCVNNNIKYNDALNLCANYNKEVDDNKVFEQFHCDLLAVLSSSSHDMTSSSDAFQIFWPNL